MCRQEVIEVSDAINMRDLIELLNELAERDLAEGADIVDHPAHIAAIALIGFESQADRIKDLEQQLEEAHTLLQDIVDETAHLNAYPHSIETRILAAIKGEG